MASCTCGGVTCNCAVGAQGFGVPRTQSGYTPQWGGEG